MVSSICQGCSLKVSPPLTDTLEVRLSDRDACLRHRETDIQSKDVELAKREV